MPQYAEVKALLSTKLGVDKQPLDKCPAENKIFYLKAWCKLLARNHHPTLNMSSSVISRDSTSAPLATLAFRSADVATQDPEHNQKAGSAGGASAPRNGAPTESPQQLKELAKDDNRLYQLVAQFSTSTIESVVMLLKDPKQFEDSSFLQATKDLIIRYKV
jgi:hypothetical protein